MHQRGWCGNKPEFSNKCDRDLTSKNWQHPAHNNLVTMTIWRASKRQYEWRYESTILLELNRTNAVSLQYESTILKSTDQKNAPKRLMRQRARALKQVWQRSNLKKSTASSAQRSGDDDYWTGVEATIRVTIRVSDTTRVKRDKHCPLCAALALPGPVCITLVGIIARRW